MAGSLEDRVAIVAGATRDAVAQDPYCGGSETPAYIGRAVAALASDPDVARYSGRSLPTWNMVRAYGLTDADGTQPHWPEHFARLQRAQGAP